MNENVSQQPMVILKAGTLLYHGTDCDDLQVEDDGLNGPAWLSSSKEVARHFATRSGKWGGVQRVITYELAVDVHLPEIASSRQMQAFAEAHGISLNGVEEIRDSVSTAQIDGWVIPGNYPNGDDILLVDTSSLDYVGTEAALVT